LGLRCNLTAITPVGDLPWKIQRNTRVSRRPSQTCRFHRWTFLLSASAHADEILRRVTKMRVEQVIAPTHIEKNCVYIISPANDLSMHDGCLRVTQAKRDPGRPVAIDMFFRSLAQAHGTRAISVILSGFGSDGAVGIGRIKELGGLTLAQTPEDAEYGEMPTSAIATGLVDIAMPVADMP
jgi:two-component system, chemotaxis family, CheB/CheR fusion protein